jgi:hypothetical protein
MVGAAWNKNLTREAAAFLPENRVNDRDTIYRFAAVHNINMDDCNGAWAHHDAPLQWMVDCRDTINRVRVQIVNGGHAVACPYNNAASIVGADGSPPWQARERRIYF